jgi:hypothetical protein
MVDDATAPAGWLSSLSDDQLSWATRLAAAMQQRMRGQSLSAAAPDTPVPDDAAASFNSRFGAFGSLAPTLGNNVPLPQPRPASAPDASALDNLYLSARGPQPVGVSAPTAPPVSSESSPSIGDRATAALANFVAGAHGGGLLGGLLGLGQGAATGERYDPIGINNQTVQALMQRPGMTPELARAIVSNPAIATQVIPQIFGAKQLQHVAIKDSLGNEIPLTFDPSSGRYRDTSGNVISGGASGSPGSGLPGPLGAGSAANLPIEIDPRTGRDEKFLAALNPIDRAAVTGVLSGDVNAQGRNMQKYLPYATRAEPGFSQQTYTTRLKTQNDFAPQGVSGKNIVAINTALGHIQQMYDATDKLGNFEYAPVLNWPYNAIRGQVSPDYQKTVAGFKATAIGSSGELAKAFRAAGMSEQDIQAWQKQFNEDSSPATIKGSADQALHMLDSRLDSIADSYNRGMNIGAQKSGPDLLSPTARAIHERLIGGNQQAPAAQPTTAPPITNGTTAVNPQTGQRIRYLNGQWLPVGKVAQ